MEMIEMDGLELNSLALSEEAVKEALAPILESFFNFDELDITHTTDIYYRLMFPQFRYTRSTRGKSYKNPFNRKLGDYTKAYIKDYCIKCLGNCVFVDFSERDEFINISAKSNSISIGEIPDTLEAISIERNKVLDEFILLCKREVQCVERPTKWISLFASSAEIDSRFKEEFSKYPYDYKESETGRVKIYCKI